jgi:ATP-dependent Lhr-like helicase
MAAFDSLHEKVRRWIRQQGWDALRDVQERSIPILLAGDRDLIIMAPTAGGKTEAAFLPIVSDLATNPPAAGGGFQAIYVSPMRALINDQFGRMESLCGELDIEVTKWHGDVSASSKARARKNPGGIVLITPESLEALLVRRGNEVGRLFRGLRYVVIDEMHVFLGDPRGKQLQSVLHRIDLSARAMPVRVGLSATLADEAAAQSYLRPMDPGRVAILPRGPGVGAIKMQLRGYISPARMEPRRERDPEQAYEDAGIVAMHRHLFDKHRSERSLIFAGSRRRVEETAVRLSEMADAAGVPPVFFAHHGNLSREHREEAERRMKDRSRPASIICTTTLELGIDVGDIEAVAQLGPGHTVSGMRQRLGRSGRRAGQDAVLRIYVQETELNEDMDPLDALRTSTVQSIAMANLMLQNWNEPPGHERLHLSTLLHQIIAVIGQHGGITPMDAWVTLVESKVFSAVDIELFKRVLRRMADPEVALLEQAPDGTLLPGAAGERLLESRDIFSVFISPEEYRVVVEGGRSIGQVPSDNPILVGQFLMLAGRRWRVVDIDGNRKEITVRPATGGNPPIFGGEPVAPHDRVVQEMLRLYTDLEYPAWLDATARQLLAEARTSFDRFGLRHFHATRHEGNVLLFPWVGEGRQLSLVMALLKANIEVCPLGLALSVPVEQEAALLAVLRLMAASPAPDPSELATMIQDKAVEKFDPFLGDDLLITAWAHDRLDGADVPEVAARLLSSLAALPDGVGYNDTSALE